MDAIGTVSRELEKMSNNNNNNNTGADERCDDEATLTLTITRGPLRVIIDTGRHTDDRPLLHSIKPASPLFGKAEEGDVIVMVDGVDTRGMTGERLAGLVRRRQAGGGVGVDVRVCRLVIRRMMMGAGGGQALQC